MTLADRPNKIIEENNLSKAEFSRQIGVSVNYIYLFTGNSKNCPDSIAPTLAKLISLELGYDADWILHGDKKE